MSTLTGEESEHDYVPEPREVVAGFLLCKLPLTVICADCVRDHHDQHRPLMRRAGRPTVGLRCDECTRYFDVDFDFTYRLAR